jgi:ADP-heptose:LPS heptosyltransferase
LSPTGRRGPDPAGLRRILLLRLRRIGDVVMTAPAAALLKRFLPSSSLTYLVEEPYRRLVEGLPGIDQVRAVPAKQDRREFIRLLKAIRNEHFDAVLDFHGGPRASWITAFSGAPIKVGYAIRGKRFLYDIRVPRRPDEGALHSVQTHAALVRALGFDFADGEIPPIRLPDPTEGESSRVSDFLRQAGLERGRFAVLHIGAGNGFRDWGEEKHAELLVLLGRRPDLRFALIGGAGDLPRQAAVIERARASSSVAAEGRIAGLAGRLNLIETKAVIARAALFIGPDSGPMHIASSTSTPIVAIFGPTSPDHFAPWRTEDRRIILQTELVCRPCRQHKCVTADFRCLRSISAGDVAAAAAGFLKAI